MRSTSSAEFEEETVERILSVKTPERKSMIIEALAKHVQKYPDVIAPARGASQEKDKTIPQRNDL